MKKQSHIHIKGYGANALLIEWPSGIDPIISHKVLSIQQVIQNSPELGIIECIPTYSSLLVEYDRKNIEREKLEEQLLSIVSNSKKAKIESKLWEVPVVYNGEDILELCAAKNMSKKEFVQLHTAPEYRVYFLGFMPGFLYLGGLDARLHTPRRRAPRAQVPKGSVAIGGEQTGVYPQQSPGGWQLIGVTSFEWFDLSQNSPSMIKAGDRIKFVSV